MFGDCRRSLQISMAMCLVGALTGCWSRAPTPASVPAPAIDVTTGSESWGYAERLMGKKTPGLDYACVLYMNWNDTVAFAVWVDHNARSKAHHEFAKGIADFKGGLSTQEERPLVDISCKTSDGKSGPLMINGQKLELNQGWLVLVKTEGGKVQIKQLQRSPMTNSRKEVAPFKSLAADPEIAGFFGKNPK
jgi:hypothetical protein